AGILLARLLWLRPSLVLIALALVAMLCGAAVRRGGRAQRIAWLPLAVLWLLLGVWCAEMEPHPAPVPALASLSDGLLRTVEGTVVDAGPIRTEIEQDADNPAATAEQHTSQRIDLRVSSLEVVTDAEDAQAPVAGGVRLTIRWPASADTSAAAQIFHCGERVRAVVRLLPPEIYHDPGVWSRTEYLLDQGITSTATVNADQVERLGQPRGSFLSCRIGVWQHATTARLLALPAAMRRLPPALRLSSDDAVMLAAMVAGDRTYLSHSLRVGFERTGSFHMLVVSGFHLAIVAGCIFWIMRRLRLPRVPATSITILASYGYALFTGFATPVQRSLWMITLYLLGRLVYRERNPMNVIGFAALCLLAVSPRSLFDSSFQMTLLAVVVIAGVAAPLLQATIHPYLTATRELRLTAVDVKLAPKLAQFRVALRMIATRLQAAAHARIAWSIFPWTVRFALRLGELLVVSCVVELAMTLPMAVYFHRITIFALPVNLFILPLLGLLLPAALIMLLALVLWPASAVVPAVVVALVLHLGVGLVHLFGSLAFGDLRVPSPLLWQSVAFCALLAAAIALAHRGLSGRDHWARGGAWAALLLAALAAVAPRPIQHPHNALLVEAIDVGQGDSLLLITPDGKTLLVDGGGFGGGPRYAPQNFDIGEEVVSPVLWSCGIRHLDAVALSHAHSDHMGGLPTVLANFHPAEIWVGNNPPIAAYKALLEEAAGLHIRLRSLRANDAFAFGRTQVHVLAPFSSYRPGPEPANNDSLVLHVAYGATSVLLEGDAELPIEKAMLAEHGLASALLKVGHHGSITSTRPAFLARVAPRCAVISCGLHNPYGHPREEVLQELESSRVRTYITAIGGAACFRLDGRTTTPDPECAWPQSP
ncbi:MAG: DNA internalization-related competence protein ComEC/Rec2, partial [Acidobacteriota bacterium]|nr:DNA internalization-related competence protein ComEC/Rec2 [Acidobacteriota bacterium]